MDDDVTADAASAIFGTSPFANAVGRSAYGARTTGSSANPSQQARTGEERDNALNDFCISTVDDKRAEKQALALDHQHAPFQQDSQQQQSLLRHRCRNTIPRSVIGWVGLQQKEMVTALATGTIEFPVRIYSDLYWYLVPQTLFVLD